MTKKNHIDLILDWLSGGDAPSDIKGKYHPEIISKHIEVVYNKLMYEMTNSKNNQGDYSYLDDYTKPFYMEILYDSTRNEYYSEIPAKTVQLPKSRGIRKISPKKNQASSFIYVSNNSINIYSELDVSKLQDNYHYYVEGKLIYFQEEIIPELIAEGLLIKLVVPFDEFDDDDEVNVPGGNDGMIFDLVVERLKKKPNEDAYNDTNSDKKI